MYLERQALGRPLSKPPRGPMGATFAYEDTHRMSMGHATNLPLGLCVCQ
jgi:hypothetical protein